MFAVTRDVLLCCVAYRRRTAILVWSAGSFLAALRLAKEITKRGQVIGYGKLAQSEIK